MSPEYITALASLGTFLVIAITAVAALVQLRHIRASNQLTGMLQYIKFWETETFQHASRYIRLELPTKMQDAQYRRELLGAEIDRTSHPELIAADWCEQAGSCIKYGLIAHDQFLDLCASYVEYAWDELREIVALRRMRNGPAMYENFEYLAALAKGWRKDYGLGNYPKHAPRLLSDREVAEIAGSLGHSIEDAPRAAE